jgi:predicted Zn-dependent protease
MTTPPARPRVPLHRRRLGAGLGIAVVALAAGLLACGEAPRRRAKAPPKPPEKKTVILSSEYDDRRAGDEAMAEIVGQLGVVKDPRLVSLVEDVGRRLVVYAPSRPFDYRFGVVDQWSPNAFTLPGGAIFVSRGLLALTNSEDELACVLGHEIIHASERHAAAQQQVARANPFLMGFAGIAWLAAYARDQERVADRSGQALCASAGYDPSSLSEFLRSLGDVERLQIGASRLPYFFETHPGTVERTAATASTAQSLAYRPQPGVTKGRADYFSRLEGIVAGANPSEGVFVGSRFLHPDLGFGISFPDGWTLVNTPAAVGAMAPDRTARVTLELDGKGNDPRAAADRFLSTDPDAATAEIESEQALLVGGFPAYEVTGHVSSQGGFVSGQIVWVAFQGNVYRISTAAPSVAARRSLGRTRASVRSFRALTPEERALVSVERVAIVKAEDDETLAELVRRTEASADVERLAVLNHVRSTARLESGQLVKIVRKSPYP